MSKQSTPEDKADWDEMRGAGRLPSRFVRIVRIEPVPQWGSTTVRKFRRRGLRMIELPARKVK